MSPRPTGTERRTLEDLARSLRVQVAMEDDDMALPLDRHDAAAEARLQAELGLTREWALLSPCLPRSERAREELNLFYFNELRYEREERTGHWYKAIIDDDSGNWPDEPGFLLIDPQARWVMDIARRCQQKLLIVGRLGEAPRHIWL